MPLSLPRTLSLPSLLLVPLSLFLGGCHFSVFSHHGVEVDGVLLTDFHHETLTLQEWPAGGLRIEAHQGNVEVVSHLGPTEIEVQLYERAPGQAHAALEEGRLVAHAAGQPSAIGNVIVRTSGSALDLVVSTGLGDVTLRGVALEGSASLSTGMGDVEVREAGSPRALTLSTGMGDIRLQQVKGGELQASTGMGDVVLQDVQGPGGEFSTGMGDIDFRHCTLVRAQADTGMGDVGTRDCAIDQRDFSSGLGSVSER